MNELIILPTENTPGIDCSYGIISFSGCSISREAEEAFDATLNWVKKYLKDPAEETVVSVKLHYIDAFSSQSLLNILKQLKILEERNLGLLVNWYYDYGDYEMVELGEVIQGRLNMHFDLIENESDQDLQPD